MPAIHEQELKKKLEEIWQSGGAGREAVRELGTKDIWRNYFHAGVEETFHILGIEGAYLDQVKDVEKIREELKGDVETFDGVDCLRFKPKAPGKTHEIWLGPVNPYPAARFWLSPPRLESGVIFFFGVESYPPDYTPFYVSVRFQGSKCYFIVRQYDWTASVDITDSLPADYDTKLHHYRIFVTNTRAKLYIENMTTHVLTQVATIDMKYPCKGDWLAFAVNASQIGQDAFIRGITLAGVDPYDIPLDVMSGRKTVAVAGTAEPLGPDTEILSVTVKALSGNSGNIYVGDEDVNSGNGYVLAPGEAVDVEIDNLKKVYIDADVSGDGVCWLAVKEWM